MNPVMQPTATPARRQPGQRPVPPARRRWWLDVLRRSWSTSSGLVVLTAVAAVGLAVSATGYLLDDRSLLGVSVWNKPAKFGISFLFFAPTLVAIYAVVPPSRALRVALELVGWSMVVEYLLVLMQATRGVGSHFNTATTFDAAVYQAMGIGVGLFTVVALTAGVILARHRLRAPAVRLAVQLAVPMMTAGAVIGYLMTGLGQLFGVRGPGAGAAPSYGEGHSVGGIDGGAGLPLLGWSTQHGDLRVAHFVGLHAAQVIPLIGLAVAFAVAHGWLHLSVAAQRRIVLLGATAYAGVIVTLATQALRGQPLTNPDSYTVAMLAAAVLLPAALATPDLVRGRSLATAPTTPVSR